MRIIDESYKELESAFWVNCQTESVAQIELNAEESENVP